LMAAYVHDSQFFTRRTIVFLVILALHVFLAWALATGLAHRAIELIAPPIQADVVQEEVKRDEPPPPPPPQLERPPVEVPPPDVNIQMPVEPTSTAIQNVTDKPVAHPPPPPKATVRTQPRPAKGFPNSEDFYPPASQRLGEQGSAVVEYCVDTAGKLTQEPKVATSSGSSRLDEAAVKLMKAGSGKISPATEDGKPVNVCSRLNIKFQLR
ncbi:MAG: TonB family protein, partial [Gammaproteobacteria bacterium]|nr:TonB family protein [Gammaproteobacteria bacterium]